MTTSRVEILAGIAVVLAGCATLSTEHERADLARENLVGTYQVEQLRAQVADPPRKGNDMKLELNSKEVVAIVLEAMQARFPGQFDTVESTNAYEGVRGLVLAKAEPAEPLDNKE